MPDDIPLYAMRYYRKALRDAVDWLENHSESMKFFHLTTGKDYMAMLRLFRDDLEPLMEYGAHAGYEVPPECAKKKRKVKEKYRKEKGAENGKS